jgi:restriction system protein
MMGEKSQFFWCVRGGEAGQADSIFLGDEYLAIGWPAVGDLSLLPKDRSAFKAAVAGAYPHTKPGAIPVYAGILYRFAHEMQPGELVIYPSKIDYQFHIGRIEGDYAYDPRRSVDYPNVRKVVWLKTVPRTLFSQGALAEANSILTVFQIKNYADEFSDALTGKVTGKVVLGAEDETIAIVALDIEQTTRDFIRKRLSKALKGYLFEAFVAELLRAMGYHARVTQQSGDGGVDVIAHRDQLGIEPPIIKVQVKSSGGTTGDPEVSALYGKVDSNEVGLFVTLGTFSEQAKKFANSKQNLRLVNGEEILELIMQHYDDFDAQYKSIIPLKRVFIPIPIASANGEI